MGQLAIRVEQLSKEYQIGVLQNEGGARYQSLRDTIATAVTTPFRQAGRRWRGVSNEAMPQREPLWALKDVTFDVNRGEVLGIIGRNGAGKSTLLKILSRIMEPSTGEAAIYGRVGSLLEVGTGFHPELTGRENIYLNGAILGMRRAEVARKFDEIIAFAELEKFIDTPVKHYSSGMYLRLAFAVAAHLESDILLADEVLAVGDAQFQKKCLGKMSDVAAGGRTVLLVSHNMVAISALCPRVLYFRDGQLQADGGSQETIVRYMADIEHKESVTLAERTDRAGTGDVRVTQIRWLDAKTHAPLSVVLSGQEVYLEVSYTAAPTYQKPICGLEINIGLRTYLDQFIMTLNSHMANDAYAGKLPSDGQLYCYIKQFPLTPGRYFGNSTIKLNGIFTEQILHAFAFDVEDGDFFGTGITYHWNHQCVYIPHRWLRELP